MPDLECKVQEGEHWEEMLRTNKMGGDVWEGKAGVKKSWHCIVFLKSNLSQHVPSSFIHCYLFSINFSFE